MAKLEKDNSTQNPKDDWLCHKQGQIFDVLGLLVFLHFPKLDWCNP